MVSYLMDALSSVLEMTAILLCYNEMLQIELTDKKKKFILAYVGMITCSLINTYCNYVLSPTMLIWIYCWGIIGMLGRKSVIKMILVYPCAYLLESILAMMSSYVIAIMLDMPQRNISTDKVLAVVLVAIPCMALGVAHIWNENKEKPYLIFSKVVYVAITVGSISFLLIISALQYIGHTYEIPYKQTNFLGLLISCVCLIFFSLFVWLSTSRQKNEMYEIEKEKISVFMSEQEKYITLMIEKDKDMRRFKHDVKGHMWSVSEYIKQGEYAEAQGYLDRIYKEYQDAQLVSYTGIAAVDVIISEKYKEMQSKGIIFEWECDVEELSQKYDIYDICTIMMNLLNNAVEACDSLNQCDRKIRMKCTINDRELYMCQENKSNMEILIDTYGNPVSSKQDKKNHGYGTKNIRSVVNKYNGDIKYESKDNVFKVEIVI